MSCINESLKVEHKGGSCQNKVSSTPKTIITKIPTNAKNKITYISLNAFYKIITRLQKDLEMFSYLLLAAIPCAILIL